MTQMPENLFVSSGNYQKTVREIEGRIDRCYAEISDNLRIELHDDKCDYRFLNTWFEVNGGIDFEISEVKTEFLKIKPETDARAIGLVVAKLSLIENRFFNERFLDLLREAKECILDFSGDKNKLMTGLYKSSNLSEKIGWATFKLDSLRREYEYIVER